MRSSLRPMLTAATAAAMVLAACSSSPTTTPLPTTQESSVPTASPAPSLEPTPVPSGEVAELRVTGDPLPPGTYTRDGFTPRITLDLDEGWGAFNLLNGFFDVQQRIGTPDVIAVQFARPTSVRGADGGVIATSAQVATDVLIGNPAFILVDAGEAVEVDGRSGYRLTIENVGTANAGVLRVPPGPLGIDPGRRLQVTFLDTADGLLAIMVGGSAAEWEATLATAGPVVASVRIGQ